MGVIAITFGILTIAYLFVLNFVLMSISGNLHAELKRQSLAVKSDPNLAEVTNGTFWSEIRKINAESTNPSIVRALRTKKVLYIVAGVLAVLFVLSNTLKI